MFHKHFFESNIRLWNEANNISEKYPKVEERYHCSEMVDRYTIIVILNEELMVKDDQSL